MISLKGKNCLITGATGGIGKEIAELMIQEGCNLFLTSENECKLKNFSIQLKKKYKKNIEWANCDFSDIHNLYGFAFNEFFRKTDILINSVGIFYKKELEDTEPNILRNIFSINLMSPIKMCEMIIPFMRERKWGRIVNIGSSSSYNGYAKTTLYCATKHGILGFSRALHDEVKKDGIRVFCVSPAGVKTKMGKIASNNNYDTFLNPKEVAEYIVSSIKYDKEMIINEIRLNRNNDK